MKMKYIKQTKVQNKYKISKKNLIFHMPQNT